MDFLEKSRLPNEENDYLNLKISLNDMRNFTQTDLHEKFVDNNGQKIGLRRLVKHFYGIDIQQNIHSVKSDAIYTMKLFNEKFPHNHDLSNIEKFAKEKYVQTWVINPNF